MRCEIRRSVHVVKRNSLKHPERGILMYKNKRFLAIIPARSGSKGIKDKNIRSLCGKPLLAYSIEAALGTGVMDAVVLSTDSEKYADIGCSYGAEVPFLRPPELSTDQSLASECIVHTIETLRKMGRVYDYFVLLQPTSPLRKTEHILTGVHMAVDEGLDAVVAFSEAEHPINYFCRLPSDKRLGDLAVTESNRQECDTYYRINGMLYISRCEHYIETRSFYGQNSKALIIDRKFAIDIDCEYDFKLAEFLMTGSRSAV